MITMEEIIKTYAGNIRRARQNKKVTQAVMAEKIGITEKYWSDIETGRKPCSLDTLVAIANAPVVPIINKTQFGDFVVNIEEEKTKQAEIDAVLDRLTGIIEARKKELETLDELMILVVQRL